MFQGPHPLTCLSSTFKILNIIMLKRCRLWTVLSVPRHPLECFQGPTADMFEQDLETCQQVGTLKQALCEPHCLQPVEHAIDGSLAEANHVQ